MWPNTCPWASAHCITAPFFFFFFFRDTQAAALRVGTGKVQQPLHIAHDWEPRFARCLLGGGGGGGGAMIGSVRSETRLI